MFPFLCFVMFYLCLCHPLFRHVRVEPYVLLEGGMSRAQASCVCIFSFSRLSDLAGILLFVLTRLAVFVADG